MAREFFGIEHGLALYGENLETKRVIIFGSAAPGGDAGQQDDAETGSMYLRDDGKLYTKIADTNATSDWELKTSADLSNLVWRSELVRGATNDTVAAGSVDVTGFSDNEGTIDGTDFAIGEYLIGDVDGSPALWEVTAVTSATDITVAAASTAIAANYTYVVQNYWPDVGAAQEGQAILHSPDGSSALVKLGDVNWDFATGINLSSGYAAANGTITTADTVESAIEKLDGNQQDIQTASGIAQGAVDYGTFTGTIITDNVTNKVALQELETALEALSEEGTVTGITTVVTVDEVLVDSVDHCEWEVVAFEEAAPEDKKFFRINGFHDGTASADATKVKDTVKDKMNFGSFDLSRDIDISGSGPTQTMRLRISSSSAGVTVKYRRTCV